MIAKMEKIRYTQSKDMKYISWKNIPGKRGEEGGPLCRGYLF